MTRDLVDWSDSGGLLARFNALPIKAFLYRSREDKRYLLGRLEGAAVSVVAGSALPDDRRPGPFYQALFRALAPKASAASP